MAFPKGDNQAKPVPPAPPDQGGDGGAPAPTYITQEQLETLFNNFQSKINEQLNTTYRGIQSMTSKVKPQLDQLDQMVKRLTEAGQQVDPGVVQRMKTDIMAGAYVEEPPQTTPQVPGQEPQQGNLEAENARIFAKMDAYQELSGIELFDDDPELEELPDINEVGEKSFFEGLSAALEKKKARIASDTPGRTLARSPMIGSGGAPASNAIQDLHGDELWAQVNSKFRR